MNEGEFVSLSNKVGFVLVDDLPAAGGCNILCLSDREVHIIRRFVYPFAEWRSRFVRWLYGNTYQTATEAEYLEYQDEIGQLMNDIGGEDMGCSELATALTALASSLAQNGGGTSGGNGCCAPYGGPATGVAGALSGLAPSEILPEAPLSIDPEGDPPDGFATWEIYNVYKCKAAHQIWYAVDRWADTCMALGGIAFLSNVAAQAALAYAVIFTVVLTPVTIAIAIASLLAIEGLSIFALYELQQFKDWWATNKIAIVCSLYLSEDAAAALAAVSNAVADGVQAIEWTGALAPLAPELSAAVGVLMSQIESNNLVNILFKLVTDVAFPDVTCNCAGSQTGWHFDSGLEGWEFSTLVHSPNTSIGQWNSAEVGADNLNGSFGRLWGLLTMTDAGQSGSTGTWTLAFPVGTGPIVHTGDIIKMDMVASASGLVNTLGCYVQGGILASSSSNPTDAWQQFQLVIPAPCDGLRLTYLYVSWYPDPYNVGVWETGIDRVYLLHA
jgi:hypothetical protein